jgi:hypothetical protein
MVTPYSVGPFYMSVCTDEEPDAMLAEVNRIHPSGTDDGWQLSTDATFKNGAPNPCPCHDHPETHKHYLLEAQPLSALFDRIFPRETLARS